MQYVKIMLAHALHPGNTVKALDNYTISAHYAYPYSDPWQGFGSVPELSLELIFCQQKELELKLIWMELELELIELELELELNLMLMRNKFLNILEQPQYQH